MIPSIERRQLGIQRRLAAADRHGRRAALDRRRAGTPRAAAGRPACRCAARWRSRCTRGCRCRAAPASARTGSASGRAATVRSGSGSGRWRRAEEIAFDSPHSQTCLSVKRKQAGHSPGGFPECTTRSTLIRRAAARPTVPIPGPTRIEHAIEAARDWLLARQHEAGFWCGELDGDTTLESYPILLEAFLGRRDSEKSARLARTIRDRALPGGGWSQYPGGPADLSVSCLSYFALKVAGDDADAPHMRGARDAILRAGRRGSGKHVHAVSPGAVRAVPLAGVCRRSRPR